MKQWLFGIGAMFAVLSLPLRAQESQDPTTTPPPSTETGSETTQPQPAKTYNRGTQKQIDKLSARFEVPPEQVAALRDKGMGWGEIRHALAISQKAGVPLEDVLKLRDSGMGWGQISRKYGFKLGDVAGKRKKTDQQTTSSQESSSFTKPGRGSERSSGSHPRSGQGHADRGPRIDTGSGLGHGGAGSDHGGGHGRGHGH